MTICAISYNKCNKNIRIGKIAKTHADKSPETPPTDKTKGFERSPKHTKQQAGFHSMRTRTVAAVERWPKWGCCNRRLLALADDGWKFIFKDNHQTKTMICDSKQQTHADKSPETPPTDRASERNKKTRDNLSIISRELREEDSNLRPPGYEPGKLTSCSTPRCIFTLNGVPVFCECKGMANFLNFQILFQNYLKSMSSLPHSKPIY